MKKAVWAAAVFMLAGIGFAKINEKLFRENFIKSEPCEKQTVWVSENPYKYRGEITYQQMKEDLANLKYILETCYSGYEKACKRGLNLEEVIARIEEKFAGQENVYSRDLAKAFYEETKKYIIDGHFSNYLGANGAIRYCSHDYIFFADYFIDKNNADSFSSEKGALFPYYKNGKEMFRVGRFSTEPVSEVTFKLNGKQQTLPVKLYSCDIPSGKPVYVEKETSQTAYIRLESFMPNGTRAGEINLEKFCSAAQRFLEKSNVIVDLRTNMGGKFEYGDAFVKGLVFDCSKIGSAEVNDCINNTINLRRAELEEGNYVIVSPGTVQISLLDIERHEKYKKENKSFISFWTKSSIEKVKMYSKWMKNPSKIYIKSKLVEKDLKTLSFPKNPAFKGRLFILTGRDSCSATEEFVVFAKKCLGEDVVTLIGENTYGCIEFGSLQDYSLPNSELTFHIAGESDAAFMENLSNWHGEGKGVHPDIWSTDEDLLETLIAVTGDEALRELLKEMK